MSDWISVEEKLPDPKGEWVLVYADGAVNCMGYSKELGFHDWTAAKAHNIFPHLAVTYWMPIPEPPEKT